MLGTRAISTTSRRELSSSFFFPARQGAEGYSRHSDRNISLFTSWSGWGLISTPVHLLLLQPFFLIGMIILKYFLSGSVRRNCFVLDSYSFLRRDTVLFGRKVQTCHVVLLSSPWKENKISLPVYQTVWCHMSTRIAIFIWEFVWTV